jgi:hypothetical protein
MRKPTVRLIVRWIHIICAIPITGYIYSPFVVLPDYAPPTRFVFFPSCCFPAYGCGKATGFEE